MEETGGPRKTTDLSQVTDKLYDILLYTSPWSRFELTTSMVIGKSSYHLNTVMVAPTPLHDLRFHFSVVNKNASTTLATNRQNIYLNLISTFLLTYILKKKWYENWILKIWLLKIFLKSKGLHVHEVNNLYKEYYRPLWSYKSINGLIDDWLID